jgi:hypothetical protein
MGQISFHEPRSTCLRCPHRRRRELRRLETVVNTRLQANRRPLLATPDVEFLGELGARLTRRKRAGVLEHGLIRLFCDAENEMMDAVRCFAEDRPSTISHEAALLTVRGHEDRGDVAARGAGGNGGMRREEQSVPVLAGRVALEGDLVTPPVPADWRSLPFICKINHNERLS